MDYIKKLFHKYNHAWTLIYIFIYIPWFCILEHSTPISYNVMYFPLDDYVPFCEYFIIPYLLWFIYLFGTGLFFFFKSKSEYFKFYTLTIIGMTIFLIISTIYPNAHTLRPYSFVDDNIFTTLVSYIYTIDSSTNVFPSIHVFNSCAAHAAIANNKDLIPNKLIQYGSLILCISIILSTIFLKQHSIVDLFGGLAMFGVLYLCIYKTKSKTSTSNGRITLKPSH